MLYQTFIDYNWEKVFILWNTEMSCYTDKFWLYSIQRCMKTNILLGILVFSFVTEPSSDTHWASIKEKWHSETRKKSKYS